MKWASALSEEPETRAAVAHAAAQIKRELGGVRPQLVVAFVSPHHASAFSRFGALVERELPGSLLIGCTAGGVIGSGHEVENHAALSLSAAVLPGVDLTPLVFAPEDLPEDGEDTDADSWRELVGVPEGKAPHFLVLPEPFTCDAGGLVAGLDAAYPDGRKIGGLASGALRPGGNALFLEGATYRSGAVGLAFSGDIVVDTIVAQGCRPIGVPLPVTRCDDNVILELNGKPAIEVLRDLYHGLCEDDQILFRQSLFIGLEMRESSIEFHESELLVRNIIGMDPTIGALVVAAHIHPWQAVQFLLRDATAATHELVRLLDGYRREGSSSPPAGALLFSCVGRGEHLFGRVDHDTGLFLEHVGRVPLGGCFCSGEIGPVGDATFLHGYTSSFALFRGKGS